MLDAPFSDDPEVEFGFLLHDVGKVAVPDSILWKPEPLTPEERSLMERHPLVGWEILREIDFLGEAKLVVRHHHERWDGAGYPDGLAGEVIPLSARVFAVADALDALTTVRPYRAPSTLIEARAMIEDSSGTQFDPEVVDAFLEIPADAPGARSGSRSAMRSVLIVDDDPFIRKLVSTTLEDVAGFGLHEAANGDRGGRARDRGPPRARLPRHRHAAHGRHRGLQADPRAGQRRGARRRS